MLSDELSGFLPVTKYSDIHVHIGQFNEVYYDALEVFNAIESTFKKTGVSEIYFSSTSSCRDDVELSKIEEETAYTLQFKSDVLTVHPYLWFVPKYAEQKINVKSAMKSFDYVGFKLHPFAQKWNLENPVHKKCLEDIFEYATEYKKSILIHSGINESNPLRFEQFFKNFPNAKVILAHSNPPETVATLVNKYKNVFCDTAYAEKKNLKIVFQKIKDKSKILFGTDFPVTNYFDTRLFGNKMPLQQQYEKDFKLYYHRHSVSSSK